jgi:hypothetical protein
MAAVGALSNQLAQIFKASLFAPKLMDVFRFVQGDFVGIHNDKGIKAIRLVSYLPAQQQSMQSGGALVLFGENDDETLLYRGDATIFFQPSALTFHAITRVIRGELLLLVADYPEGDS